jgi:hypothetical protein
MNSPLVLSRFISYFNSLPRNKQLIIVAKLGAWGEFAFERLYNRFHKFNYSRKRAVAFHTAQTKRINSRTKYRSSRRQRRRFYPYTESNFIPDSYFRRRNAFR